MRYLEHQIKRDSSEIKNTLIINKAIMKDYNKNIKELFDLMSLNENYKVIGSASKDLFFSDYDLNSILNYKGKHEDIKIYKAFKTIFQKANQNENIWITDFKVGEDESGEPLRWSYDNILKNDNKGYTFQDALNQKSTIKLDITFYLDGKFIEITDNYFFNINGYKTFTYLSKEQQKENLIEKFYEYVDKNAYMKALKRLRSLTTLSPQQQGLESLLQDFFNSPIGLLYSLWSEISVIIQLIELDKQLPLNKVFSSLERIKEILSFYNIKNNLGTVYGAEPHKNRKKIRLGLEKQNKAINEFINKKCCEFVKRVI